MTETDLSRCDSCTREVAIHLLFPYPLSGKPYGVGFRCNICVDTENRLVAHYGQMRDDINKRLENGPFHVNDLSQGFRRNYLHMKNFPTDTNYIIPPHSAVKEIDRVKGMSAFLEMQDNYVKTGEITEQELLSTMTFMTTLAEYIDSSDPMTRTTVQQLHRLISESYLQSEEEK